MNYWAHSPPEEGGRWEALEWHLRRTAALARRFTRGFDAGNWGVAAGLLHDIGKYTEAFQNYIQNQGPRAEHSTAGAKEAKRLYGDTLGHLLAYGIAGHHAGLPNGGSGDDRALLSRLKGRGIPEGYERWEAEFRARGMACPATDVLMQEVMAVLGAAQNDRFAVGFFARMVFSALVDADFLATEWFLDRGKGLVRRNGRQQNPAALAPVLRDRLDAMTAGAQPTKVNVQRAEILAACRAAAARPPGVFTLQVPTGGGKTLSSLSFALEHAAAHGLERVIYAIPYTSIIEQTADVFRAALAEAGADVVLEHHSAAEPEPEKDDRETLIGPKRLRLATENWDVPVIVTTTVQLFESIYASRTSRSRKLHNLARSVIVLDEAQSLPMTQMSPCLAALRELVQRYGASLVLCSATLPALDGGVRTKVSLPPSTPIVPQTPALHAAFRRVETERVGTLDDDTLAARLGEAEQALCIVDARRHAAGLFGRLPEQGRYHLSAAMCPAHRRAVLAEVKERLEQGLPCRLVSTRVIEAGVDVDFPEVWRSMAGIDSLAQAAGRCNREGRLPQGRFVVFEPADPDALPKILVDLVRRVGIARETLHLLPGDPLDPERVEDYFRRLFAVEVEGAGQDICGVWKRLCDSPATDIPFRWAAETFRMIDSPAQSLIVPWRGGEKPDKAAGMIEDLRWHLGPAAPEPRRPPRDLLRGLQAYTVACYNLSRLVASGDAYALDPEGRFHALTEGSLAYHPETGLTAAGDGLREPAANVF